MRFPDIYKHKRQKHMTGKCQQHFDSCHQSFSVIQGEPFKTFYRRVLQINVQTVFQIQMAMVYCATS